MGSGHGNPASAPGHTKPPGSQAAVGRAAARSHHANGRSHAHGGGSQGHHKGKG
jgi:hypothetical protein